MLGGDCYHVAKGDGGDADTLGCAETGVFRLGGGQADRGVRGQAAALARERREKIASKSVFLTYVLDQRGAVSHSRKLVGPAIAIHFPSRLKTSERSPTPMPPRSTLDSSQTICPVSNSQRKHLRLPRRLAPKVPSALASRLPSTLNATQETVSECP